VKEGVNDEWRLLGVGVILLEFGVGSGVAVKFEVVAD
jgi:hypothetical protein